MQETHAIDEPVHTVEEIAQSKKLHPSTVRKRFKDEPGVLLWGSGRRRTLRIPRSVADRVFARMTVGEAR
jgi:hypothetical protein